VAVEAHRLIDEEQERHEHQRGGDSEGAEHGFRDVKGSYLGTGIGNEEYRIELLRHDVFPFPFKRASVAEASTWAPAELSPAALMQAIDGTAQPRPSKTVAAIYQE
jgi:hypothetical protein